MSYNARTLDVEHILPLTIWWRFANEVNKPLRKDTLCEIFGNVAGICPAGAQGSIRMWVEIDNLHIAHWEQPS